MELDSLFAEVYPALFRYCHRLTGDADSADDLAQEAFVRFHEHEVSGELPGVRAWLFKVATHLARDRARVAAGRQRLLESYPVAPSANPAPDADAQRAQEIRGVREALDTLAERDREILLMKEEGFSYQEIADAVGVASTSVGTLLSRAQLRFAEVYRARHGGHDSSG